MLGALINHHQHFHYKQINFISNVKRRSLLLIVDRLGNCDSELGTSFKMLYSMFFKVNMCRCTHLSGDNNDTLLALRLHILVKLVFTMSYTMVKRKYV